MFGLRKNKELRLMRKRVTLIVNGPVVCRILVLHLTVGSGVGLPRP